MSRPPGVQGLRFKPIDKQAPVPAFPQIAVASKDVLGAGHLPPGTPFPPERLLCDQFSVSRMTIRQANHVLEHEGFIERHPGRGTFVAIRPILKHENELRSVSEDISARGARPSSTVHSFPTIHPGLESAEFFGLPRSEWVYEIQRVRFRDGTPIAFDTAELPCFLCKGLALQPHRSFSLSNLGGALRNTVRAFAPGNFGSTPKPAAPEAPANACLGGGSGGEKEDLQQQQYTP